MESATKELTNPELARRTEIMGLRMAEGQGLLLLLLLLPLVLLLLLIESNRVGTIAARGRVDATARPKRREGGR